MSALSSGKIDKYEYLTGKEMLFFYQRRVIEQAKEEHKEEQTQRRTIKNQGIKQVEALKTLKSEENQDLESIEGLSKKYEN